MSTTPQSTTQEYRNKWYAYYSEKRITHHWLQCSLLGNLGVQKVLEVGPYMGLTTHMLSNAGYDVTTLDIDEKAANSPAKDHVVSDIRQLTADKIKGFDAIICCETLEHIAWEDVDDVIKVFKDSGAKWIIVSVPYQGLQFGFSLYLNPFKAKKSTFLKIHEHRNFKCKDWDDFDEHKWETGWKGYSTKKFKDKFTAAGLEVTKEDFSTGCRSLFLVLRNNG